MRAESKITFYLLSLLAILIWSAIRPHDYFTWFLEVLPALAAVAILAAIYRRFEFTGLVYFLVWLHCIILIIGGHYTYAQMPLFNWLRDEFGLARNHYDRVGHFAQGFVPAIVMREALLRTSPLKRGRLLSFIVVCICLAFSALYELVEWQVSLATGSAADSFLGTQGDVWDTQKDMTMCLIGSIVALLALAKLHDNQLRDVTEGSPRRDIAPTRA